LFTSVLFLSVTVLLNLAIPPVAARGNVAAL
jgi:hypothetical protein